jgi:hypothetical protein
MAGYEFRGLRGGLIGLVFQSAKIHKKRSEKKILMVKGVKNANFD